MRTTTRWIGGVVLAVLSGVAVAQPEEVVDGRFLIDSVACEDLDVLDGLNGLLALDPATGLEALSRLIEGVECIHQTEDQWVDLRLSSMREHPLHGWRVQVSYPGARVWWWAYASHVDRR